MTPSIWPPTLTLRPQPPPVTAWTEEEVMQRNSLVADHKRTPSHVASVRRISRGALLASSRNRMHDTYVDVQRLRMIKFETYHLEPSVAISKRHIPLITASKSLAIKMHNSSNIPVIIIITMIITLRSIIIPAISGLELSTTTNRAATNDQWSVNRTTMGPTGVASSNVAPTARPEIPPFSNQYGSQQQSYNNEIALLWKDLSVFSDKASTMITSSSVNSDKRLSRNNSNNDLNRSSDDAFAELEQLLAPEMNSTSSLSSTQQQLLQNGENTDESYLITSVIIANIVIFTIGFCGNSLVILVILKFTRIETVTDIYILNLAFADLMFLFGLVFLIITMFIDHWIFGNLMCKLYMATTSLNQFASSLLLVVMSFDRFLAVCHPIYAQRFRRLRRAKAICLCIWIACLVLMSPIFAFANVTKEGTKEGTCAIVWPEYNGFNCEIAFTLYSFAIGFALPLMLIAAFYACVIRKLRIAASGPINLGSTRRSKSRETTNKRIEHLVIGIICTYTICWLPYWISQLCVSFTAQDKEPMAGFYPFMLVSTCLSYTNSALNPILYAFLSDNFKRRCSDVFDCIYQMNWCSRLSTSAEAAAAAAAAVQHSTIATTVYEPSEVIVRPESRQTVIMNESVRLVTSSSQMADIISAHTNNTLAPITRNNNHHSSLSNSNSTRNSGVNINNMKQSTLGNRINESNNLNDINHQTRSSDAIVIVSANVSGGDGNQKSVVNDNNCSINHHNQRVAPRDDISTTKDLQDTNGLQDLNGERHDSDLNLNSSSTNIISGGGNQGVRKKNVNFVVTKASVQKGPSVIETSMTTTIRGVDKMSPQVLADNKQHNGQEAL